jgi:hypothetical protein
MTDQSNDLSANYSVSIFTLPNAPENAVPIASAINDLGEIVGAGGGYGGFIDNHGVVTQILIPEAPVNPLGINNLGQVVGQFTKSAGGFPFIDTNGTITYIGLPPAAVMDGKTTGINDLGQAVGQYTGFSGSYPPTVTGSFGFIDNNGTITQLTLANGTGFMPNGINDFDQVAGTAANGQGGVLDVKTDKFTPVSVPGATSTVVSSINNLGQVAGWYTDKSGGIHGFVDTRGVFATFNLPASVGSLKDVTSINDLGQLIGTFVSGGVTESFVATPQDAGRLLSDLLPSLPQTFQHAFSGFDFHGGDIPGAAWHAGAVTAGVSLPFRFGET